LHTVIVVSTVVVLVEPLPLVGAADAAPPKIGRVTVSATPVARMIRAVRFMAGPSARRTATFTCS
jgi:hypothetical protein